MRTLLAAIIATALLLMSGCVPVYMAPAANAPLLGKAGEFHAGGHIGTNGIDGQIGYAAPHNLGVIAAISAADGADAETDGGAEGDSASEGDDTTSDSDDNTTETNHEHFYGEMGVGGWWRFADVGRFEVFGGMGYGISSGEGEELTLDGSEGEVHTASGDYLRPFIQADLGLVTDLADLALINRLAHVRYNFKEIDGAAVDDRITTTFWESIFMVRGGWELIKLELQTGFVVPVVADQSQGDVVETFPFHITMGVRINWGGPDDTETSL